MSKIAIVIQTYGLEINGGAELHARLLAEKLNVKHEVEIITTCAKEYHLWENYYEEGPEVINEVKVHRFRNEKKNIGKFKKYCEIIFNLHKYKNKKITAFNYLYLHFKKYRSQKQINFKEWLEVQGPFSKGLINYIKENKDQYDVFIFFTYLYYPTNIGIKAVSGKSILIPTAHDEPAFYLKGYGELFSASRFIMYNMQSEKDLVERVFPVAKKIKSEIAGLGFEKPKMEETQIKKEKKYFIYIGRMEDSKGCQTLIDYFKKFSQGSITENVELIFIGENIQNYTEPENIRFLGFVDENIKNAYLQNSEALIIPSLYESLSMVTLEAMVLEKPVLANRNCEVLKNHIEQSEAGFLYENYEEFEFYLNKILNLSEPEKMLIGSNGKNYVKSNYDWDSVLRKFDAAFNFVMKI